MQVPYVSVFTWNIFGLFLILLGYISGLVSLNSAFAYDPVQRNSFQIPLLFPPEYCFQFSVFYNLSSFCPIMWRTNKIPWVNISKFNKRRGIWSGCTVCWYGSSAWRTDQVRGCDRGPPSGSRFTELHPRRWPLNISLTNFHLAVARVLPPYLFSFFRVCVCETPNHNNAVFFPVHLASVLGTVMLIMAGKTLTFLNCIHILAISTLFHIWNPFLRWNSTFLKSLGLGGKKKRKNKSGELNAEQCGKEAAVWLCPRKYDT